MTDSTLAPRHLRPMPVEVAQPELIDRTESSDPTTATATRDHAVAVVLVGIASVYWVGSLRAVIFGHLALIRIDDWNGWIGGKATLTVAIVLGYVGLGLLSLLALRGIMLALIGRRAAVTVR